MSRLRSSKIWQAIRLNHGKEHVSSRKSNNTTLPVEILEMIFVHLNFWTLLRCRNVCRLWHNCIPGTSPIIRRTLFLSNPCTENNFPDNEPAHLGFTVEFADGFADTQKPQSATEYTVHPAGKIPAFDQSLCFYDYNPLIFFDMTQAQLRRYRTTLARAATGDERIPLWMTMYATYPPVRALSTRFVFLGTRIVCEECWIQQHRTGAKIEDPRGITVERVLEAVCDAMWWPDMYLSKTGDGQSVQLLAREEGERAPLDEETRIAAEDKADQVRGKNTWLPRFKRSE